SPPRGAPRPPRPRRPGTTGSGPTLPRHAAGTRAAQLLAASRSAASKRYKPIRISFASAYGPSVTSTSPPGPPATVIVVAEPVGYNATAALTPCEAATPKA